MKIFHVLPANDTAINFISMMVSYSGVIQFMPTTNIGEFNDVLVIFHENDLICSIQVHGKVYEGSWNGNEHRFQINITTDAIDPKYVNGYIGDYELELLYNLFVNKKPIVKGNQKAAIVDRFGVSDLVCTNCTLESLVANNSYFGKHPL